MLQDSAKVKDREFNDALEHAFLTQIDNKNGTVADYIPELSKANPNNFGLAITTTTGKLYEIGNVKARSRR